MPTVNELLSNNISNAQVNVKSWNPVAYNVLEYKLKNDGVTDNTAALQALVDLANTEGRRAIYFPHGQYRVTALTNADQIVFFGDNASFVGGYGGKIYQMGDWATNEQLADKANQTDLETTNENVSLKANQSALDETNDTVSNNKTYTDSQLSLKRDKGTKIIGADLDTSTDANKVQLINLSEAVQAAMAGTAPVIGSVSDGSLTTPKYADNSITIDKRTPLGDFGQVFFGTGGGCNIDTINKTVTFTPNFRITHGRILRVFTTQRTVNLLENAQLQYLLFDVSTQTFRALGHGQEGQFSENEVTLMTLCFESPTNYSPRNVFATFEYTVNGESPIKDEAITLIKRTPLGVYAAVHFDAYGGCNVDTLNKTVTFTNGFRISYGRTFRFFTSPVTVNLQVEKQMQFLVFDIKTSAFKTFNHGEMSSFGEHDLILMSLSFKTPTDYTPANIFAPFKYTVDGIDPVDKKIQDKLDQFGLALKSYYFAPANVDSHFHSVDGLYPLFNTVAEYHTAFGNLVSAHPEYLSRTLEGLDQSGTHEIYRYHAKPTEVAASLLDAEKKRAKITLVVGLHGGEKTAIFAMYYLMKNICENWQSDPVLEYLRWNIEIVFNPLANPYAFDNFGPGVSVRLNSRGVDLNRNFSARWDGNLTGEQYSGTAPASEVETQYVEAMFNDNQNSVYIGDFHTNGSTATYPNYDKLMWFEFTADTLRSKDVEMAGKYIVEKMTREYIKNYTLPSDEGYFGYTSYANVAGAAKTYAAETLGLSSCVFECAFKLPTETEYFSDTINQMATDYLGSWLLTLINQFKQTY